MEKYNLEQNIKNHPKNNQQFLHLFFNIIFDIAMLMPDPKPLKFSRASSRRRESCGRADNGGANR